MVRDGGRRRILYDFKAALDGFDSWPTPAVEAEALRRNYFNVIRTWA